MLLQPAAALIAISVLLPMVLFAFAAWTSYCETLREAEARVERTVRILEEHALKVFETHRLVIQQVNGRLRFMDWSREADRADLHALLARLQDELDQVSTITVTDAEGRMRASGRVYPVDPTVNFADRDYFQALKSTDQTLPYVSSAYPGRQSGQLIFNLAGRAYTAPGERFVGTVAVSADRGYFETFYKSVDPSASHSVILVRGDGAILASEPKLAILQLPESSALRHQIRLSAAGAYTMRSRLDGVDRIFAYHQIGSYPVYVRFGLSKATALEPWRATLFNYGIVAVLASLALVAASALAVRQTQRERLARRRWEETAAALQAEAIERGRIEGQLRQSQKMEAVGRLTGGVAHDFNNLLTAVIGSLDLLRRRPGSLDERGERLVANALEGAERAASLTNRLLAFSRQQPLQPVRVDANQLVDGMSDLLRRTLGETIAIETRLAGDLWATRADFNQLESAVLNLAVNARDAMPRGGRLTIETDNAALDAMYAAVNADVAAGDYVMIAVTDTGAGMAPEVVSQIFEPFFTTKPVGKGTGLGLSQVYGFVKQSGGHVTVYSEPGHGSTFRLYLPRSLDALSSTSGTPRSDGVEPELLHSANGETVLVVEDEERVRRLSVAALEEAGYTVLAAGDGPTGLDLIRRHHDIALLFTDVVLAGPMNGRVLADMALRERPDLPILFTTGYTRDAITHDGQVEEGLHFLGKPFTSAALVKTVHNLMKTRAESAAPLL